MPKTKPRYKIRYVAPWWIVTSEGTPDYYTFIDWSSALEMVNFMIKTDRRLDQMSRLLRSQ